MKCWADEAQAGIKIAARNINSLSYADDTTLMAENKDELKNLSVKVKGESVNSWLKIQHSSNYDHGILSHYFIAIIWEKSENSGRFYLTGLQSNWG